MGDAKKGFKKAQSYTTIDPDSFFIQDDPTGPYFDERINLPLVPEMVANIVAFGVRESVIFADHEGKRFVASGRQRAKHWREACKIWKESGQPIKPLPCIINRLKPEIAALVNISCNEFRQNDSPMGRITKAVNLIQTGTSEDDVCVSFGIKPQQLKNWIKADSLCAAVKKQIESGKISITAACKFHDLPPVEQKEKVEEIIAESGDKKPSVEKATRVASGKSLKKDGKKFSEKKITEISDDPETPEHFACLLKIITGEWAKDTAHGIENLEWLVHRFKKEAEAE